MNSPQWLERTRAALVQRRLPPAYIERLLRELSDHLQDLKEENMDASVGERLGAPEQIADEARRTYRAGFFRRHRWLAIATFIVLPIPLLVILFALTMFVIGGVVATADTMGILDLRGQAHRLARWQSLMGHLLMTGILMVSAALVTGGYCLLARRTGSRRRWTVTACLLVAIFSFLVFHQYTFSDEPGKSTVMIGLRLGSVNGWQVAQLLAPLLVAFWLRWGRKSSVDGARWVQ